MVDRGPLLRAFDREAPLLRAFYLGIEKKGPDQIWRKFKFTKFSLHLRTSEKAFEGAFGA